MLPALSLWPDRCHGRSRAQDPSDVRHRPVAFERGIVVRRRGRREGGRPAVDACVDADAAAADREDAHGICQRITEDQADTQAAGGARIVVRRGRRDDGDVPCAAERDGRRRRIGPPPGRADLGVGVRALDGDAGSVLRYQGSPGCCPLPASTPPPSRVRAPRQAVAAAATAVAAWPRSHGRAATPAGPRRAPESSSPAATTVASPPADTDAAEPCRAAARRRRRRGTPRRPSTRCALAVRSRHTTSSPVTNWARRDPEAGAVGQAAAALENVSMVSVRR
jgi:hypothetical protein